MFRNMRLALTLLTVFFLFIPVVDSSTSQPSYSPPPPPIDGRIFISFAAMIFGLLIVLLLIWKAKSKGAILGAIWGLIGLITHVALVGLEVKMGFEIKGKILLWIVDIIALPSVIWAKIAYQLWGGGSVLYNPLVVLLFSVSIGALIGYVIEKIYRKYKEIFFQTL